MKIIDKRVIPFTYVALLGLIMLYKTNVYYTNLESVRNSFDLIQRLLDLDHHVP
jgi:hypothetical protein